MNARGITIIETLLAAAITAVVAIILSSTIRSMQTYFLRMRSSQQMTADARSSMDTITQVLRRGMPSTVAMCTCTIPGNHCLSDTQTFGTACVSPSTSYIPSSQIEFDLPGGTTHYAIYLSGNSILMKSVNLSSQQVMSAPATLASNVTELTFGAPNTNDLAIITVGIQMAANGSTFSTPVQEVEMRGQAQVP